MTTNHLPNFDDTKVAFADKSNFDLWRMHFLFNTMNQPVIARLGIWLTIVSLRLNLPVKAIIKKTIFAQFCGGESLNDCISTMQKLAASNIKTILNYSAEGEMSEEAFDGNRDELLKSFELAKGSDTIPTGVMKLTGFTSFDLLAKKQNGENFTTEDTAHWHAFMQRVEKVCQVAVAYEKYLFIDAEESWIQQAIDEVVDAMMEKFNKKKAYIFNTYQLYRIDSLRNLKDAHAKAKSSGYKIGAKLVRGAYLEKERERAQVHGYPDPIQPDKISTDRDYDEALKYCFEHLGDIYLCAGTHNEASAHLVTRLIAEYNLSKNDTRIYLAQLYGMSDNISYVLSREGYNVAKYVPYGPITKVLPYLMRRAQENTSIAGQSSREFLMVKKERLRRKSEFSQSYS